MSNRQAELQEEDSFESRKILEYIWNGPTRNRSNPNSKTLVYSKNPRKALERVKRPA